MYYNLKKHKEFFFLDLFVYLIPFAIIIGNLALNSVAVICILVFYTLIFIKKEFVNLYKKYLYILLFLLSFLVLNLLLSSNQSLTSVALINFFKNYSLFLIIFFCSCEIKNFNKFFSIILFFTIIFVLLDVLYQHFFLVDIFGYQINSSHGRRLAGPFGEEGVAGTYMSKLFFLSIIFFINNKIAKKIIFPLILITLIIIILTNERSVSIMFFFTTLIFFIFYKYKLLYKLAILFSTLTIIFLIFINDNNLKSHFIDTPLKAYKDNHHKAHFLTAIEIFKDNKVIGSGVKTYRHICKKEKYRQIETKFFKDRCSTHPHNIYFEILSETGVVGLILILLLNFYILSFLIINFFKIKAFRNETLIIFCNFFILFWPFQTTGSFFSSWNGIFYWIFFSYFFYIKKKLTI